MKPTLRIKRERPDAKIPKYQTSGAAGMDLCAIVEGFGGVLIEVGKRAVIRTGLAFEIPEGYELQLRPRSGLARNSGITLANSPATIDSDYRGEVSIVLINHGDSAFAVFDGDRICQAVLARVEQPTIEVVLELSDTDRGSGGFGSTGK